MFINDYVGVLALKHELQLFEYGLCVETRSRQLTEGVVVVGTPKEAALWEASLTEIVAANSDVVVAVETCNRNVSKCNSEENCSRERVLTNDLAPELNVLKGNRNTEFIESQLELETLIDVESDRASRSQVFNLFGEGLRVHYCLFSNYTN